MPLSLYSATSRGFWIYTLFINVAFFGKIMRSATQTADIISRNFNLSLEFCLTLNDKLYTIFTYSRLFSPLLSIISR